MKRNKINLMAILICLACSYLMITSCVSYNTALPFAGTTKHHPIKRMTTYQVRQAQHGNYLYTNNGGVVKRNTMKSSQYIKRRK
jgi:hypothetical protein